MMMLRYRKITNKPKSDLSKLEDKLWEIFSIFIRLRDSDHQGICKCITCGKIKHWTDMHAGHGIGRQHKATKFNEKNSNAQCVSCNSFNEGRKDIYKDAMNKKYGPQTWEKMEIASRMTFSFSVPLLENNIKYYKQKVEELKSERNML